MAGAYSDSVEARDWLMELNHTYLHKILHTYITREPARNTILKT